VPEKKDQPKEAFFDFFVSKRGREVSFCARLKKRGLLFIKRDRDPLKTIFYSIGFRLFLCYSNANQKEREKNDWCIFSKENIFHGRS